MKVLHDYIAVKPIKKETARAGSIILPENITSIGDMVGEVLSVGTGKKEDGTEVDMSSISKGDTIVFSDTAILKMDTKEDGMYYLVKFESVFGKATEI